MSDSVIKKIDNKDYKASVGQEGDLGSQVSVMGDQYTVTFDGNDFQNKHLRRIRRDSVTQLKDAGQATAKLGAYTNESKDKAIIRFGGNPGSSNSLVFLDLFEFCKFGAQIIKFLKTDSRTAWAPFGNPPVMQKHVTVSLDNCFALTNSGTGEVRPVNEGGKLKTGVGMTLNVVVRQVDGNPKIVSVCHLEHAGSSIRELVNDPYFKRAPKGSGPQTAGRIVN